MFKILVVEDDKDLNQTVCAHLNRNGFEAIGCLSANDAYNEMYGNLFDMIISDIMMPQIDGYEFAKTVREMNQDIPILFMTAREDFESKRKGFGVDVDDYMVKPIDLDELLLEDRKQDHHKRNDGQYHQCQLSIQQQHGRHRAH